MREAGWLDEEEMAAWRAWIRLSERVRAGIGRDLARDHALSEAEYAVLVHLSEDPDHLIRMTDLAAALDWSKSRLSHLVARMEAKGLLTRSDCPSDARGSFASLTDGGMAEIAAAAPSHVASVRRHFLDHLDRQEMRDLTVIVTSTLERIAAAGATCGACDGTADDRNESALCPGDGPAEGLLCTGDSAAGRDGQGEGCVGDSAAGSDVSGEGWVG